MDTSLQAVMRGKLSLALLFGVLGALLAVVVMMQLTPRYKVRMDFLIVQNTQSTDFYALFKSSEFLGKVLGDAIYTDQFIDSVLSTPARDILRLPANKQKRLVSWHKMVSVTRGGDLGRMSVDVVYDDALVAQQTARSIAGVLMTKNTLFRGGAKDSIDVRLLTGPILQSNPSISRMITVGVMGFLMGFLLVVVLGYYRILRTPKRRYSYVQYPILSDSSRGIPEDALRTKQWEESMNEFAQQLKRSHT